MKVCFDTSALVAGLLQKHPHHVMAFGRLQSAKAGTLQGHLTTHAMAELYSTLTAMPLKPRLRSADVERMISESILAHLTVIELTKEHYREAIKLSVHNNVATGAIYDALHLVGARSVCCTTLYTLNLRHFRSLAPGDSMITSP
jgi:predicted nucleic acid-binding protein